MDSDGKSSTIPFNASREVAALRHERKNQSMKRLPPNTIISRRPLSHPAIASPHAGSNVQKVVYVSTRTPIMAAVKRVKKLLKHVEKRAIQSVGSNGKGDGQLMSNLAEVSDKLARNPEEVLVKASGRAMAQALRVGEWFRSEENDYICKVEIRSASVAVVDDILDDVVSSTERNGDEIDLQGQPTQEPDSTEPETTLEGGDTTMELLGNRSTATTEHSVTQPAEPADKSLATSDDPVKSGKRRRRKRKRETYDQDEVPEARVRWIKAVEVAISLRG